MGLFPSKVEDDYVLRLEDNKPKFYTSSKPGAPAKSGKGPDHQAVHPTIIKFPSSAKEQPPINDRENYNYGHSSKKTAPSGSSSSKGSTRYQPPSSGGGQSLPAVIESGRPMRRLSHQSSQLEQTAALVSTKSTKNLNIRCSVEYPWLIKAINLNGTTLAEMEFGRIIGKIIILLCYYLLDCL